MYLYIGQSEGSQNIRTEVVLFPPTTQPCQGYLVGRAFGAIFSDIECHAGFLSFSVKCDELSIRL